VAKNPSKRYEASVTLQRAGEKSTPSSPTNNRLPIRGLGLQRPRRVLHHPYQHAGRLHPRALRPAEAHGPDARPLQVHSLGIKTSGDQRQPHGHDSKRVLLRVALPNTEESQQGHHPEEHVLVGLGGDSHHTPLQ
jgi:hypothetical protein